MERPGKRALEFWVSFCPIGVLCFTSAKKCWFYCKICKYFHLLQCEIGIRASVSVSSRQIQASNPAVTSEHNNMAACDSANA